MDGTSTRYKNTQWKVFVSSTGFGLGDFRDAARDVIKGFRYDGRRYFEPVVMEEFGAVDGPAREVCADRVRDCDLLVGIVGIRYGDHPPDDQTSFTEIEFQTAVEHGLPRLMYLLDEQKASALESASPQGDDRADRQRQFRRRVAVDRVSDITVGSVEVFKKALRSALKYWVENDSFKLAMVDHSQEFRQARTRLLDAAEQTGGAMLIFGAPGTGKTTLFNTLLNDVGVRHAYHYLIGPITIRLADADAAVQAGATVSTELKRIAGKKGTARAVLPSVLITLFLESDRVGGKEVDAGNLAALEQLFSWDVPCAVVIAETNSRQVRERLDRDVGWGAGAVITISDYDAVGYALEQMARDAPDVDAWPDPDTRILAEALGLRPISLYAAAKDIEAEALDSQDLVGIRIGEQLEAIGSERSGEDRYEDRYKALIGNSIKDLSQRAKDVLALTTVLHPKPTRFPDAMVVALDLSTDLDRDEAIEEAKAIALSNADSDLTAGQLRRRAEAARLIRELVGRGLLERTTRPGPRGQRSRSLLTLHPANVQAIHEHLPLTDEQRAEGHARAEAFYRALVGEAVSGSFDSRFRMENDIWWERAEEWIYHFSHITPDRAGIAFATLFLDAYWWWDLYVSFDFCDRLLDYAHRPRVQAVPKMPEVARLLARFRDTYPREHESTLERLHVEIAGEDPGQAAGPQATARKGAGVIPVLRELCQCLGITELDALFASDPPGPGDAAPEPDDQTHLHLLGLICLYLAEGHRFRAELEPDGSALAAAEACYRRAESYFLAEEDGWDVGWARYLLGEVVSERGGDPDPLWDQSEDAADEDSDTELLANVERARGDHLRKRDLNSALVHYGRAVFYGMALQVTSNLDSGADPYTQALYREMQLHAVKVMAEPALHDQASPLDARVAEASRRLKVMLGEWGDSWQPDQGERDEALGEATRKKTEESAAAIAAAAFPPGPGDAVLGEPDSDYYRVVDDLIERTRTQPWVKGLSRWAEHREQASR